MPIRVFDVRSDLSNLVVEPEIRSRFRRVDLGPVPPVHSHDLGGETFLVMDGQIEFTVAGEHAVCTPGQGIYVPPRTTHAVRAVGDRPGAIYLSVAPHVEPTHTFYDDRGTCLPPRYGVWRAAGGAPDAPPRPAADLLDAYLVAAAHLASLAAANAARVHAARAVGALATSGGPKPAVDDLWASLRPLLEQVRTVERAWNALALVGADGEGGG